MREEKNTIIRLFEHSVKGKQKVFHNFPRVSNPPIVISIISRKDRLYISFCMYLNCNIVIKRKMVLISMA